MIVKQYMNKIKATGVFTNVKIVFHSSFKWWNNNLSEHIYEVLWML